MKFPKEQADFQDKALFIIIIHYLQAAENIKALYLEVLRD